MNFNQTRKDRFASKINFLIFVAGIAFFSSSCVTNKQAVYVQPGKDKKVDFEAVIKKARTIKPGDELYIRISSDDEQTNMFSRQNTDDYIARTDITLVSYLVNEEGYIRLSPIGNIQLKGLTLEGASSVVEKALIGVVSTPSVSIKYVNKTVTVLGEVNHPGRYEFYDQRINILQALGYAGDISEYGNREKVMLVREENNVVTRKYLNLTDESILGSYYYFIKPDDVIYVEPLRKRHWGFQTFPFSLILSSISTLVLVLSYVYLYAPGK